MEVIQTSEAFAPHEDDIVFSHTKLIIRRGDGQYFYSRTQNRFSTPCAVDIDQLDLNPIPAEDVWPVFNPKFTRAPQPLPPNAYVKKPSLLDYGDTPASCKLGNQVLNEVKICEILMANPHPNISRYLGCVVEGDRVTGLCFARYDMTLSGEPSSITSRKK